MEKLASILKEYGLRKMVFGLLIFSTLSGLLWGLKLTPEAFTTVVLALIGGMFAGNVGEHIAKKGGKK